DVKKLLDNSVGRDVLGTPRTIRFCRTPQAQSKVPCHFDQTSEASARRNLMRVVIARTTFN
ncbi:MAG: hypothetical protein OSJ83_01290, partial [Clostridia bacterium]|nr:hypothetical protein [Clostridia bacterium]